MIFDECYGNGSLKMSVVVMTLVEREELDELNKNKNGTSIFSKFNNEENNGIDSFEDLAS
jgi:hypothetical protein